MLEPISLALGAGIAAFCWIGIYYILKLFKKKKETKTSLPQLKSYVKEAHNHLVESANNLNKLYNVFNDIDNERA